MIFDKLIERRATLRNPTPELWAALTGGNERTASGERISPTTALYVAAYFAAIRAISEDVAKLPLPVYKRLAKGRERVPQHPVDQLMNVEPNNEMSPMTFRATMLQHAMGWGNGYAAIQFAGDMMTPYAIWPIDPSTVSLWRLDDDTLEYRISDQTQGMIRLAPRQMFHVHGMGFNGLTGYSIAYHARETLGLAKAQETSGAALFGSGSRPGGILSTPMKLKKEVREELREQWEALYGGSKNTNKTAILHAGFEWTPISTPNKDAQWIEARVHSITEVARWFRMPPHKLQELTFGTYSNVDAENISYVTDALASWMTYFEQEVARRLLSREERKRLYVKHNANALLRGDSATRFEAYQKAINAGWMSRDDVRELEEMNPLPDGQGSKYLVAVNMQLAEDMGQEASQDDAAEAFADREEITRWLKRYRLAA